MTSRLSVLGLVLLLVGCNGDGEIEPTDNGGPGEVQLVGGQAICDSCASVRIALSGPGIVNVREATLVTSDPARAPVPARIVLARESGASGDVLFVTAYFDEGISEGEYNLWLDPVSDRTDARVVPGALRVTRPRPGAGERTVLRVSVQSTGVDRDGRFLLRTAAGCREATCAPVAVEADAPITLQVPPGAYTFQLDDVASNCTLGGTPNPYTVTLERGKDTALNYLLSCTRNTTSGWVRVANVTTGADFLDKYQMACSTYACPPFTLAANRDTVLRVVPGELTIRLAEALPNCTLTGTQTVAVTVTVSDTVDVGFAVACRAMPAVRVTVSATGRDIDPDLPAEVCSTSYYGPCFYQSTSSSDVITFPFLPPDDYFVHLYGLAENCTYAGPSSYTVTVLGSTVTVAFAVTCRAFGTVRVSTVTSGTNQDTAYRIVRQSGCTNYTCAWQLITSSGSVEFRAAPGRQTFLLEDVASNCAVTTTNPASVMAIEDGVVDLRFEVACQ
jgi:hypothetical protein